MKKGDRVTMIKFDGWALPTWSGTVSMISSDRSRMRVKWDNGKTYSHTTKNVRLIGAENEPNMAFLMHKYNKEKKK